MSTDSLFSTDVDPSIWRACVGSSVRFPTVDSLVYYFPQGHAEQSSSPPILSPLVSSRPCIHCRVIGVRFLANSLTDEVFAQIQLLSLPPGEARLSSESFVGNGSDGANDAGDEVVSFAKILTPSDANNGGGFSVPRFCADSVFPPLDFTADPPVQNIMLRDTLGNFWEFRHIYRGTPRRHLLTTGWSKFVNSKKLIAGDTVVFMRSRKNGELFVGVRRAASPNADCSGKWSCPLSSMKVKVDEESGSAGSGVGREGFTRNGKGRLSPQSVADAAEMAVRGLAFEVVYYPTTGLPDFVVKADAVVKSMKVYWAAGMRVKMAMETEDSSRMSWFLGTVSSTLAPENGPWRGSPWRMLQVTWDEPEVLPNVKSVSPWQVESVVPSLAFHSSLPPPPPPKKFRLPQYSELLPGGEGALFYPMTGLINSLTGHSNPSLMNYTSFPAGMQGARQDNIYVPSLSNFVSESAHHRYAGDCAGNNLVLQFKHASTKPNRGCSQSENLSFDSQSSVHSFGTDLIGKHECNSPTKVAIVSFQLFGKVIQLAQPVGFDGGCTEDDCNKADKKSEGVNNLLDLSLTYPCTKLFDRPDVHCQSASAVEACSL